MFGKLFKRDKTTYTLRIEGYDKPITCTPKTFVLQAGLDEGLPMPYSCRVGGCGTCKVKLLEGRVKEYTDKSYLLTPEELQQNYILACQSVPRSDLRIEVPHLDLSTEALETVHKLARCHGRITRLRALTHDVVEMTVDLDGPLEYTAGEYAEVTVPGALEEPRNYSFASRPDTDNPQRVQFHVRKVPGGAFTEWLNQADRTGAELQVNGPYGDMWLRSARAPIVCVAGGSGMAPIKAILEQAAADQTPRDCVYLFGARSQGDLFCVEDMERIKASWHPEHSFGFIPVLSEEPADSDWQGRRGMVHEFLQKEVPALGDSHAYMAGPPPMLDAANEVLREAGVPTDHIHSDKFLDKSHLAKTTH